ncbi:MAG: hypothetical protein ACLFMX_03810 [Halobacteriales archaeon]
MALESYLLWSGLMLALVVALAVGLNRRRRHAARDLLGDVMGVDAGEGSDLSVERLIGSPVAWVLVFLALVLAGVGTVAMVLDGAAVSLVAGVLAVGLVGYLAVGSYLLARNRGHSSAMSFFESVTLLGLLGVTAAVGHLIFVT